MQIDKNFEGSNITIITKDFSHTPSLSTIEVDVELRDTQDDWFYWAFHVTGAAGRTLRFDFSGKPRVGYYGPAVSYDLIHWQWGGKPFNDYTGFTYSFSPTENSVYFCHHLCYSTQQFSLLCKDLAIPVQTLATSKKGRAIPYVELGTGEKVLLLTSRHHACESTGTYVLEGILQALAKKPIAGFKVVAVPFVDMDGVVDGDQGKNRRPHDHNRDYSENSLYAAVKAIQNIATSQNIVFALDLHSPWHFGGRHDVGHGVRKNPEMDDIQSHFGALLTQYCKNNPKAFQYDTKNDLLIGVEWNVPSTDPGSSFSAFFADRPGTAFALSLETPYFGEEGNIVTQKALLAFGGCIAAALAQMALEQK